MFDLWAEWRWWWGLLMAENRRGGRKVREGARWIPCNMRFSLNIWWIICMHILHANIMCHLRIYSTFSFFFVSWAENWAKEEWRWNGLGPSLSYLEFMVPNNNFRPIGPLEGSRPNEVHLKRVYSPLGNLKSLMAHFGPLGIKWGILGPHFPRCLGIWM